VSHFRSPRVRKYTLLGIQGGHDPIRYCTRALAKVLQRTSHAIQRYTADSTVSVYLPNAVKSAWVGCADCVVRTIDPTGCGGLEIIFGWLRSALVSAFPALHFI
jgi:hypothetical protein